MSTATTTLPKGIVIEGGLMFNKKLKRCADMSDPNKFLLFTYNRISDEEYHPYSGNTLYSKAFTYAWLLGNDDEAYRLLHGSKPHKALPKNIKHLIDQAEAEGRIETADFIRRNWRKQND